MTIAHTKGAQFALLASTGIYLYHLLAIVSVARKECHVRRKAAHNEQKSGVEQSEPVDEEAEASQTPPCVRQLLTLASLQEDAAN